MLESGSPSQKSVMEGSPVDLERQKDMGGRPMTPEKPPARGMRYENTYVWLIFVSCLDIMLTWIVLWRGGREANALAAAIIHHFGLPGIVLFKLTIVVLVIGLCEWIGRHNHLAGGRFARWAVALSAVPVVIAVVLLSSHLKG
jgi:hypothetical protein